MSLTLDQFENHWSQISKCLVNLGQSKKELDLFKSNLNKTETSVSNEKFEQLKLKANEFYKREQFQKSIDLYNQAIEINNLSTDNKAVLFSNRSLAYLKLYEQNNRLDRNYLFKALVDAEQANIYKPQWSKTYARLGQVYAELNEYKKSIDFYTQALVLDPSNEEYKNLLAKIKNLKFEQNRFAHLDESSQPKTSEERRDEIFKKVKERLGDDLQDKKLIKQFEALKKEIIKIDKSYEDVFMGNEYRDGSSTCKQNFELAAKYYAKAAQKGNPEAMYNLALLHREGKGVKLDNQLAVNLFKQASSKSPVLKYKNSEVPVFGVVESKHALGIMYEYGMYVNKNISLAIEYYQSAVDQGSIESANNLGLLYMSGDGVAKDLDRAENLFLLCHKRGGNNDSITNLVTLYMLKGDPEKALLWHKRDLARNSVHANERNSQIMKAIEDLRQKQKELNIPANQSVENYVKQKFPHLNKLAKLQKNSYPHSTNNKLIFDPKMISQYADNGSVTAQIMLEAMMNFYEALELFKKSKNINSDIPTIVDKITLAYELESVVCQIPIDLQEELIKKLELFVNKKEPGPADCKARLCLMYLRISDYKHNLEFINESIKKHPDCTRMYEIRGVTYSFMGDYKRGLKEIEYVLRKEPDNSHCMFYKAGCLKNLSRFSEAVKAYEQFIEISPVDARSIPESYYSIGYCKLANENKSKEKEMKEIKNCLRMAEKSEKLQLPCFLPVESQAKVFLKTLLELSGGLSLSDGNDDEIKPIQSTNDESKLSRNEYRIDLIKKHRKLFDDMREKLESLFKAKTTIKPPRTQKMPYSLVGLKEITLNQIDFSQDEVLMGYVLSVRVFDVPIFGFSSVFFVIDDDENQCERLSVYNLGENYDEISQDFSVGTWLMIINPYVRLAADGSPAIRVDDPKSIIFTGRKTEKMCRYCGRENSKFTCSKCTKACYCSRDCQSNDWKELNHKHVCF
ncbi:unnamed protein product [Brachionus calyciflorus]|nr:unnamed protein product [Brachionus calyciflorus]